MKKFLNNKGSALIETVIFAAMLVFFMCGAVKVIFVITTYERAAISDHIKFLKD